MLLHRPDDWVPTTKAMQFGFEAHAFSQLAGVLEGMGLPIVPPVKSVDCTDVHEADCPYVLDRTKNTLKGNKKEDMLIGFDFTQ